MILLSTYFLFHAYLVFFVELGSDVFIRNSSSSSVLFIWHLKNLPKLLELLLILVVIISFNFIV